MKKVIIDGTTYVEEDPCENYVICRAESAGVFSGFLKSRDGSEVVLKNARRIWYWEGAASLSELAMKGTSKPESCKFPCPVDSITILGVIEIIPCTQKAKNSIESVSEWKAH